MRHPLCAAFLLVSQSLFGAEAELGPPVPMRDSAAVQAPRDAANAADPEILSNGSNPAEAELGPPVPMRDSDAAQALRDAANAADLEILSNASNRSALTARQPLTSCEQTEVLCPTCATYDMLDWVTLDVDLRATSHLTGTHDYYTVVWPGKIWYLKTSDGKTWDINLYDNNFIYLWITGLIWDDPTWYDRYYHNHNVVLIPRTAHGGYPGTRTVSCNTDHIFARNCVEDNFLHTNNIAITELYGPYDVATWGNIGPQTVLKITYYWACSTTDPASCGTAEVNWYSKRYGWIRWGAYHNSGGTWVLDAVSEFFNLVSGTTNPVFPCF